MPEPVPPPPEPVAALTDAEITAIRDVLALLENGRCLPPCPDKENQLLVSVDLNGDLDWGKVEPPAQADNQNFRFGQAIPAPYWPDMAGAAQEKKS